MCDRLAFAITQPIVSDRHNQPTIQPPAQPAISNTTDIRPVLPPLVHPVFTTPTVTTDQPEAAPIVQSPPPAVTFLRHQITLNLDTTYVRIENRLRDTKQIYP